MANKLSLASVDARINAIEDSIKTLTANNAAILKALNTLNASKQTQAKASAQQPKAAKKPVVKAAKKPALPKASKFEVVKYSDKAFLAYGEATKHHVQALKSLGGKFNRGFAVGNEKVAGWIFSSKRVSAEAVANLLANPTKSTK